MGAWLAERAPAKVNLFLHVVGRRPDGYHLLDSLAVFPGPGDVLRGTEADALTLKVVGPFAPGLAGEGDNLVLRAARALAPGRGARLVLEKNLPVASGIGGGSADAAAALRLLSRLWGAEADLHALGAELGADVPACVASVPVRMGGVGEVLGTAPALPPCTMLLVNPLVAVSTPDVFRRRRGTFRPPASLPLSWSTASALCDGLNETTNDLEQSAREVAPVIGDVLDWLRAAPGCLLARMSGSGATCFGLFPGPAPAAPPTWWAAAGRIGPDQAALSVA